MENYYEILRCDPNARHEDLKESYHKLILENHPDKTSSSSEEFRKIDRAWKTLRDADERKRYDEILRQTQFENQRFVFGYYTLNELNFDPKTEMYSITCRCGGLYKFTRKDFEEFNSCLVGCDDCSLMISVDLQDKISKR